MARVNVKFPCKSKVSCSGVEGTITAVIIRGKGRAYEFSYIDRDGNPTSCTTEECELELSKTSSLGFKKNAKEKK